MCHCTVKPESNIKSCVHLMHFDKVFKKKKNGDTMILCILILSVSGNIRLTIIIVSLSPFSAGKRRKTDDDQTDDEPISDSSPQDNHAENSYSQQR